MYSYIYKTTNLVNGKIYIGQKKSKQFLGNRYLGSGRRLHCAIMHYGKENFNVSLIEEIDNPEEMDNREIYWIKHYDSTNPEIGYNLSLGGNTHRDLVGIHNGFYGKKHSIEARKINSEKHKGKTAWNKGLTKNTDERVKKYSVSLKVNIDMNGSHSKNTVWINKNNKSKMVKQEELPYYLSLGYNEGRVFKNPKEMARKISQSITGRKRINNGIEEKTVVESEVNYYLSLGWKLGRRKFKDSSNYNKAGRER